MSRQETDKLWNIIEKNKYVYQEIVISSIGDVTEDEDIEDAVATYAKEAYHFFYYLIDDGMIDLNLDDVEWVEIGLRFFKEGLSKSQQASN